MPSDIIYYLTFYLIIPVAYMAVIGPLETLFHELGHAIVNRVQTHQPVHVYLGLIPPYDQLGDSTLRPHRTWVVTLWHITFYLQPFSGPVGFTYWEAEAPDQIWTYLTGPLVSLLLGIILSVITYLSRSHTHSFSIVYYIWQVAAICAFAQFALSLIPMRYPSWFGHYAGLPSDGYKLLQFIRNRKNIQSQYNGQSNGMNNMNGMGNFNGMSMSMGGMNGMNSMVGPDDVTELNDMNDLEV
ncbi:MAG TPA: hypothetical protein DHW02_23385 [Ktedonobacter sp.]|nr:hypothetical protein [Ktedonobacter sp.]